MRVALPHRRATLQVGHDAVERVAQLLAVGAEHQDHRAQQTEDQEVERAVDRDQPQDDLVAQRPAA